MQTYTNKNEKSRHENSRAAKPNNGAQRAEEQLASAIAQFASGNELPSSLPAAGLAASAPSAATYWNELGRLVGEHEDVRKAMASAAANISGQYLRERGAEPRELEEFFSRLSGGDTTVTTRGGTVVRTFFWGFHIEVSHEDLDLFLATAATVNTIVATIGGGIPSPAQPWILLVAGFIAAVLALLKGLDRGKGVYISMSWFAPGVFIPTSV
ncbi:MAG TPA: hypothetical protein VJU61_07370 [Polyangiaceae bacterium]|nr:hypothetical protein [Polyangiaceae bacterium]